MNGATEFTSSKNSGVIIDLGNEEPIAIRYKWLKKYVTVSPIRRQHLYRYYFVKRLFDMTAVIVTAPIWLLIVGIIALMIKLSDWNAPVLFRQKRLGLGGKPITIYKFRSMVPNAEELKQKYAYLNELEWPDFKITNDPRVTKIGHVLRRTSLDELPQLFNVIKNDIALVGPRPTSISVDKYELWQTYRLTVIPGVTGLWQILGRGKTNFEDKTRLDIFYIQHKCTRLDLEILFRSFYYVLKKEGAK